MINFNVMDIKFSDLVQYFKDIATKHKSIGQTPGEKHFYRFEIDEVLSGLKNINYPALILEGYRCDFTDDLADNILKNRSGAFILLDHVNDIGDFDQIHLVWDNLENIADDILIRIKRDKRDSFNKTIKDFKIGSVEYSLLANEQDRNYGIRCTFTISSPLTAVRENSNWITD